MAKVTNDVHHVAHTYANPVVVSVSSATVRAYTMLHQTEWCDSVTTSQEQCRLNVTKLWPLIVHL